MHFKRIVVLKR